MAHAHHHHAAPSVVEGRTGFRRGAAFIIGGLSSGHGVFHSIAQSFIVVLPEVRDLLLGGSVIAVNSIQSAREIASGVVALPGGVLTDALRRYWGWVMAVCMALFGVGWLLMAAAGWQVPGSGWVAPPPSAVAAGAAAPFNPLGYALLIIGMSVVAIAASVWHLPAMAALSSHFTHRRGAVLSFHGVGGNIGDVLGPVITGALLAVLAWQAIITIYAAVPIFLAFLVFWAFRDIGQRAQAAVEEQAISTMRMQIDETKLLVRNPRVWGITVVAGIAGYGIPRVPRAAAPVPGGRTGLYRHRTPQFRKPLHSRLSHRLAGAGGYPGQPDYGLSVRPVRTQNSPDSGDAVPRHRNRTDGAFGQRP